MGLKVAHSEFGRGPGGLEQAGHPEGRQFRPQKNCCCSFPLVAAEVVPILPLSFHLSCCFSCFINSCNISCSRGKSHTHRSCDPTADIRENSSDKLAVAHATALVSCLLSAIHFDMSLPVALRTTVNQPESSRNALGQSQRPQE